MDYYMEEWTYCSSCAIDDTHVVAGTSDGRLVIYRIPTSVISDEDNQMGGALTSTIQNPDTCMTVCEIEEQIKVCDGSITSLVHCRDARRIVYFATSDVDFPIGVLCQRDGQADIHTNKLIGNWYWD
jgi:hypothetical protein